MELNNSNLSPLNKAGINQSDKNQMIQRAISKLDISKINVLSNLQEGDLIEGEIIDITHNQLKLLLNNGEEIHGQLNLLEHSHLNIGQRVAFTVISADPSKILLTPEQIDSSQETNPTIEKALLAAGLPLNKVNKSIVENLIKQNMPINKDSLKEMVKNSIIFKGTPIETLISMVKNNIPLTKENIDQYIKYSNQEHQLLDNIENIKESISSIMDATSDIHNHQDLLDIILASDNIPEEDAEFYNSISGKNREEIVELIKEFLPSRSEGSDASNNTDHAHNPRDIGESLADNDLTLLDLTKGLLKETTGLKGDKLFLLKGALNNLTSEELKGLLEGDVYKKFIKSTLNDKWSLKPNELLNKDNMKKFYNDLHKDMEKLKNITQELNLEDKSFINQASNIQNNVSFMDTLNNLFHYIQLPLLLEDKNAHGDLYVFKNKKGPNAEDDPVRLLLHLEMPSLGVTNIHLTLKNNNIDAQFFIEDEGSRKLITTNLELVETNLLKLGYIFNGSVKKSYEPIDFDKDIMKQGNTSSSPARYSFDIRA